MTPNTYFWLVAISTALSAVISMSAITIAAHVAYNLKTVNYTQAEAIGRILCLVCLIACSACILYGCVELEALTHGHAPPRGAWIPSLFGAILGASILATMLTSYEYAMSRFFRA